MPDSRDSRTPPPTADQVSPPEAGMTMLPKPQPTPETAPAAKDRLPTDTIPSLPTLTLPPASPRPHDTQPQMPSADAATLAIPPDSRATIATDSLPQLRKVADTAAENIGIAPREHFGKFEVVRLLGQGGMGVVHEVIEQPLGRHVALKRIRRLPKGPADGGLTSFEEEARILATLQQEQRPGIVGLFDYGRIDAVAYFTMPLFLGGNLRDKIHPSSPWKIVEALELIRDCAVAIEIAHQAGLVHRDLKPENILLDRAGSPWITDFGIAWRIDPDRQSRVGARAGTVLYMAPEQILGLAEKLSPQTDIYALGVMLFELLTGRVPFGHTKELNQPVADPKQFRDRVVHMPPYPPSAFNDAIPTPVDAVVLKCLAKEPQDRYSSAAALAEDLERLLSGEPVQAEVLTPWQSTLRLARRNGISTSTLLATVLQILFGSVAGLFALIAGLYCLRHTRILPVPSQFPPLRAKSALLTGTAAGIVAAVTWLLPPIQRLEQRLEDARFLVRGPRSTDASVVIIGIDAASIDEWTRPMVFLSPDLATIVRYLRQEGAAAVGIDFIIPDRSEHLPQLASGQDGDAEILGQAVAERGRVVLPVLQDRTGRWTRPVMHWLGKHELNPEWTDLGFVNMSLDDDGVPRRQNLRTYDASADVAYPQFSLALFGLKSGLSDEWFESEKLELAGKPIPLDENSRLRINYIGPPGKHRIIPFRDVLALAQHSQEGTPTPSKISWKDTVVLIGVTDTSQVDRHLSPYGQIPPLPVWRTWRNQPQTWMPGVEVQANILSTLLDRAWIQRWDSRLIALALIPLGLLLGGLLGRTRIEHALLIAFLIEAAWCLIAQAAFTYSSVFLPWMAGLNLVAITLVLITARRWNRSARRASKIWNSANVTASPTSN